MRIIPAIDVIDGQCVRLSQGDYGQKKIYNESPLDVAKSFEDAGLKYVHLVDLDGAKAGKVTNWKVIDELASLTKLDIDFGGGIKTDEDIQRLFDAGVKQVNLGSIAVKNPDIVSRWITEFGGDRIIISADVKGEMVSISGWLEDSKVNVADFISGYRRKGISFVTCTDINTDGMLSGPNIELYKKLLLATPDIRLIASGGVSNLDDLRRLKEINVEGAIVGKAIYEGRIHLNELRDF